jgi:DNA-binding transcriptional regulator PaaX
MKRVQQGEEKSLVTDVLMAFVPYTEQNLNLVYRPKVFFKELERATGANRQTLASTVSRAKRTGLLTMKDGVPTLTVKGQARIAETKKPDLLSGWLLVSFDIPEDRRRDRYALRHYLKIRGFRQVQKSLWCNQYDYAEELRVTIAELHLHQHVCLFLATSIYAPLLPKTS